MSWILRFSKRLFLALLLLVLLVGGILGWLLFSQSGLRLLVARGLPYAPGEASIAAVHGSLLGGLSLEGVTYRRETALQARVERLKLVWRPRALFDKTAHVKVLHVDGVRLQLPPSPPKEPEPQEEGIPPIEIPQIQLPLRVVIDDLRVTDFSLQQGDAAPFVLDRANLRARADENGVRVEQLAVDAPLFNVASEAGFQFQPPHTLSFSGEWRARPPELPEFTGKLELGGDVAALTLRNHVAQPFPLQLDAGVHDLTGAPRWQAQLAWQEARWPLAKASPTAAAQAAMVSSRQGELRAEGADWQHYRVELTTHLTGAQIPPGHWRLEGHGDWNRFVLESLQGEVLQGRLEADADVAWHPELQADFTLAGEGLDLQTLWSDWPRQLSLHNQLRGRFADNVLELKQLAMHLPETETALTGTARVELGAEQPRISADLEWRKLRWPLTGKVRQVHSEEGTVHFAGTPQDYVVQLDARLQGEQIPQGKWHFTGQGSDKEMHIEGLRGELLQGALQLAGDVAWQPGVRWELHLTGADLNPGAHWQEVPGKLESVDLRSRGELAEQPVVQVDIAELDGRLRGYPLRARGSASGVGMNWTLRGLDLRSGSARLRADGVVGEVFDATWNIDAPDLSELLPQLHGTLQAKGTTRGKLARPAVKLDLHGKQVGFEAFRLAQVDAAVDVDLNRNRIAADIQARDLRQEQQALLEKAQLELKGEVSAHVLDLAVDAPQGAVELQLDGGYDLQGQAWSGKIQALQAQAPKVGEIALQNPAGLRLSAVEALLEQACLAYAPPSSRPPPQKGEGIKKQPRLCADLSWRNALSHAVVSLSDWDLGLLQRFLPPETQLSGSLGGQLEAQLAADGALQADAALSLTPGVLRTELDARTHAFPHRGGEVRLQITPDQGLQGQLVVHVLDTSGVRGSVHLPALHHIPLTGEQPLQARMQVDFADLGIIGGFVPLLKDPGGELNIELAAGGSLTRPALENAALHLAAATEVPDLGIELKEIRVDAQSEDAHTIGINGAILSGEGQLGLSGKFKFPDWTDWGLYLEAIGERLQVADTPDVRAWISPDLALRVKPDEVAVRGKLTVPSLHLTPNLSFSEKGSSVPGAVTVSSDVVIIDSSTTEEEAKSPPPQPRAWRTDVQIRLVLGDDIRVSAVGFDSRLAGSLLVMTRPGQTMPLGNGELQIRGGTFRAYGQDLEIHRGLINYADGPLDNPGLNIRAIRKIYNDPGPKKVEVAGVHILGTAKKPQLNLFSEPMADDAEILSYIVTGGPLTGTDPSKRTLSLGTYLTKDLYAGVGISLFNQSKTLNLRYDINPKWGLEAILGEDESGVDFSYTIGR